MYQMSQLRKFFEIILGILFISIFIYILQRDYDLFTQKYRPVDVMVVNHTVNTTLGYYRAGSCYENYKWYYPNCEDLIAKQQTGYCYDPDDTYEINAKYSKYYRYILRNIESFPIHTLIVNVSYEGKSDNWTFQCNYPNDSNICLTVRKAFYRVGRVFPRLYNVETQQLMPIEFDYQYNINICKVSIILIWYLINYILLYILFDGYPIIQRTLEDYWDILNKINVPGSNIIPNNIYYSKTQVWVLIIGFIVNRYILSVVFK